MAQDVEVRETPLDYLGVGFGPSNLALAVAAEELSTSSSGLFLERSPRFQWHPGMMIDGSRMQISFLKDLVSMRNLASPYTFLQYAKAHGRLEQFINLNDFRPTRVEFHKYLSWVAEHFSDSVRYNTQVTRISPVVGEEGRPADLFRVEAEDTGAERRLVFFAKNVAYAAGGTPRMPESAKAFRPRMVHSSDFLPHFPACFADRSRPYSFVIVGDGQSAGEIAEYLLNRYEQAVIHLVISGYALRATDDSPFVNEQFFAANADAFYKSDEAKRRDLLAELRDTNYGVIERDLLERLHSAAYLEEVKGRRRLIIHACSRAADVCEGESGLRLAVVDRFDATRRLLPCDGGVFATGYERSLPPKVLDGVLAHVRTDDRRRPLISRGHRVRMDPETRCGLYVQGYAESWFGLGDTLLSLLPFRAAEIANEICGREADEPPEPACDAGNSTVSYPPRRHLEDNPAKQYAVIERFPFATMVSARGEDDPVVTQLPLTLDRTRGEKGVLVGHLDRLNPHAQLLDGRRILLLFNGPNSYISPTVYETDQLPTWNSITVRVHGRARLVESRQALVDGLVGIADRSEPPGQAVVLRRDDPRIDAMIHMIVGFEVEIEEMVGRFKLSQDRSESDQRRAAGALARRAESNQRDLIEYVAGLPAFERDAASAPQPLTQHANGGSVQ